mgnify:CR=1 FL=1
MAVFECKNDVFSPISQKNQKTSEKLTFSQPKQRPETDRPQSDRYVPASIGVLVRAFQVLPGPLELYLKLILKLLLNWNINRRPADDDKHDIDDPRVNMEGRDDDEHDK